MPSDPRPDLHWLAFRYVAGELAGDEAAAFELRLDEDQEAREAVAEAVELAGAVSLLAPDVLAFRTSRRHRIRHALGWMATGAAACLAGVAGLHALSPPEPIPAAPAPAMIVQQSEVQAKPEVALAWSGLRGDDGAPETDELMAWLDEPAPGEADGLPATETTATAEDSLPLWLLEAASLSQTPGPSGSKTQEN